LPFASSPNNTPSQNYFPAITFTILGFTITLSFDVKFTIPTIDIYPASSAWSAPLAPNSGEFTVKTEMSAKLLFNFMPPIVTLPTVQVLGLCEPVVTNSSGTGTIGLNVKSVKVTPNPSLGAFSLETLMFFALQAILSPINIPFTTFTAGEFGLILQNGPQALNNEIEMRGDAL
jgi:hypothetical protein